jgi:hypothetical protein
MQEISLCPLHGVALLPIHSFAQKQVRATPPAKLPMRHVRLPRWLLALPTVERDIHVLAAVAILYQVVLLIPH